MTHNVIAWAARSFLIGLLVFAAACQRQSGTESRDTNKGSEEVTVYVSTDRVFSEPILKAYEQKTGVKVNAVYDTEETKSTGLANKLLAEKNNPQARSSPPTRRAKARDVFSCFPSEKEFVVLPSGGKAC